MFLRGLRGGSSASNHLFLPGKELRPVGFFPRPGGPNGWIAKTRKTLQNILKEDQLNLKQWDFSTYTQSFYETSAETTAEVVDAAASTRKERANITKQAVNSAAETLVALAKPDESAMELLRAR